MTGGFFVSSDRAERPSGSVGLWPAVLKRRADLEKSEGPSPVDVPADTEGEAEQ